MALGQEQEHRNIGERDQLETLSNQHAPRQLDLNEVLPVVDVDWPEGLSLRREDLYDERV